MLQRCLAAQKYICMYVQAKELKGQKVIYQSQHFEFLLKTNMQQRFRMPSKLIAVVRVFCERLTIYKTHAYIYTFLLVIILRITKKIIPGVS